MKKTIDRQMLEQAGVNFASLAEVSNTTQSHSTTPPSIEKILTQALQRGDAIAWNTALNEWQEHNPKNPYVTLKDITVDQQNLKGFSFFQVVFDHTTFKQCTFEGNSFIRSHFINKTHFDECSFSNVHFMRCFMNEATMTGSFHNNSMSESVVANSLIEGRFSGKNLIADNKLFTCSEIHSRIKEGESTTLDLANGPLQFKLNAANASTADKSAPTLDKNQGVHSTTVSAKDHCNDLFKQPIDLPKLENGVIDVSCVPKLGDPRKLTDDPQVNGHKAKHKNSGPIASINKVVGYKPDPSLTNLTNDLWGAEVKFGAVTSGMISGFVGFGTNGFPLRNFNRDTDNPAILTASFDVNAKKLDPWVSVSTADLGLTLTGIAGNSDNGLPFKYTLSTGVAFAGTELNLKKLSLDIPAPRLKMNKPEIYASAGISTFVNRVGVGLDARVSVANKPAFASDENYMYNPDGTLSPNYYSVNAKVNNKFDYSVTATVSYKINKSEEYNTLLFARGSLTSNRGVDYDAKIKTPNDTVIAEGHGLHNTGIKPSVQAGIRISVPRF